MVQLIAKKVLPIVLR